MGEKFTYWCRILIYSVTVQFLIWPIYSWVFGLMEARGSWHYWVVALGIMTLATLGMFYLRNQNLKLFFMIFLGGFTAEAFLHATSTYANSVFNLPIWMRIVSLAITAFVLLLVFFKAHKYFGITTCLVIGLNFLFGGINSFCDYNLINLIRGIL
ncbi:hypothetical protein [Muriicola marianensis]|nr:hypothetical protein [Muriicola marianensis]